MPYFKDTDELVEIMGGYLKEASRLIKEGEDEELAAMQKTLMPLGLTVRIDIKNTTTNILMDYTKDPFAVVINDTAVDPLAVFTMSADTAHKFWHGKVNLAKALALKEIGAKGPITKILKVLPAIAPLIKLYPKYLADIGRQDLVVS